MGKHKSPVIPPSSSSQTGNAADIAGIESQASQPTMRPIAPPLAELKDPLQWETEYNAITVKRLAEAIKPGDRLIFASNTRSPFEVIVRDAAAADTNLVNTQRFAAPYFVPQGTLISKVPA
jgi:hypothetical protein